MLKAINEARVFHYLTKPVHPDELRAKVRAAAEDHKTRTENKRLLAMVKSLYRKPSRAHQAGNRPRR